MSSARHDIERLILSQRNFRDPEIPLFAIPAFIFPMWLRTS